MKVARLHCSVNYNLPNSLFRSGALCLASVKSLKLAIFGEHFRRATMRKSEQMTSAERIGSRHAQDQQAPPKPKLRFRASLARLQNVVSLTGIDGGWNER